jgi:lactoylglutathione lyase
MQVSLNHVGVIVDDLEESVRFYQGLLELERLPAPAFNVPVAWLRAGDLQVHLTERQGAHTGHFALSVHDLAAAYRRADEAGCLIRDVDGHAVFILPSGEVQLYLHDPSGNVIELNHPDAERWRDEIPGMVALADLVPQPPDAADGTLFLPSREAPAV